SLARVLMGNLDFGSAYQVLNRALTVSPTPEVKSHMVRCLNGLGDGPGDQNLAAILISALSEPWGRVSELADIAARTIKRDAAVRALLDRMASHQGGAPAFDRSLIAPVLRNRLLCTLLESTPVCDVELEQLLTVLRAG